MGLRRVCARIARWLIRLYPAEFRARYGADVDAALDRACRDRSIPAMRLVVDSVLTLWRAWRDRMGGEGTMTKRQTGDWSTGFRYTMRSLVRDPLHAIVSVLTLALAIGANAAVFSVAYAVLLRTLPYDEPDRTVRVEPSPIRISGSGVYAVLPELTSLPQVEAAATFTEGGSGNLSLDGGAEPVHVTHVDGLFFDVLGARLHMGRPIDGDGSGEAEVVLSFGLWQRVFGGDPAVIGRTVRLTDHVLTVVGVAAPEVAYPAGTDMWLSYPVLFDLMGAASGGEVIARIARSEDISAVRDAHEARMRALRSEDGETFPETARPQLKPLRSSLVGPVEGSIWLLFGASALVLLLGCVNLAGLSLARVTSRRGEFAVRRALGAGRSRLMGMVLSESMVVATLAGLTALLFVVWGRALLERLLPAELPGLGAGGPGLEALLLVLALVIVTGFAVGIIPAMQAVHVSGGDTAGAAGRVMERRRRLHPGLVVAQIALAVVLVVSAGLLARSVLGLRAIPLGFDTDRIVTFEARLPWAESWDTTEFRNFAHDVRDRLVAQPGILEVGIGSRLPLSESMGVGYRVWGEGDAEETSRAASLYNVSSSYFSALGIAFLAGDTFEDATSAQSAIISRTVAQQLFGGVDVVGRGMRVRTSFRTEPRLYTVVGVVGDVRANGFTSEPGTALYLPFDRQAVPSMAFALRADRHLRDIVPLIRSVVSDVNPEVAPFALRTMSGAASERIAANQALALVSTLFGATALLLAILGIYGLVAQSVTRRRKEMGLRLAVGARSADLARLVLAQALALASLGVGIGILASLGATRFLASFLFGVGAADPLTFAGVALMALVAILAASLLPARRAARVDPLESLRTG